MPAATAPKRLFQGAVPTGQTTVYAVPGQTSATIRSIQFTNTTASPIAATVWVGISPGTVYLNAINILPNANDPDSRVLSLNTGDIIAVSAAAPGLNVCISGSEIGI